MLPSEIPKLPTDLPVRGFPGVWKLLFFYDSLPRTGLVLNSFVSLFIFYFLFYLLLKTMGILSGFLVSSPSVHKLFCGICSAFKWSFDEFVGEKVVAPSYSSAILGLPLMFKFLIHFEFNFVYGVSVCSKFIDLHVTVQLCQHHLLKRLSFSYCIFFPPLLKINWL